ncbi:MAG: hypothetical protein J1E63_08555 [Muribaculaceae bacterium]|nr:hypothetical protein [Muribaculaceae bacterium]
MKEFVEKNSHLILAVVGALMFVAIAFLPIIDLLGKQQYSGFQFISQANKLNFQVFLVALMMIAPIVLIVKQFVDFGLKAGLKENFEKILLGAAAVLFLLLAVSVPEGVTVITGAYIYFVLALLGLGVCYAPAFLAGK